MNEMEDRIARLPAWARQLIRHLEIRSEPAIEEAARARGKVEHLEQTIRRQRDVIEAMTEMFHCAALGGSEGAKTVVKILEGYEIFPTKKEGE